MASDIENARHALEAAEGVLQRGISDDRADRAKAWTGVALGWLSIHEAALLGEETKA